MIISAADKVDEARKDTEKLAEKSDKILQNLSEKQKELDINLSNFFTKIYLEDQKREAESHRIKRSFLGDLFKSKDEPVELPDDWEEQKRA